MLRLAPLLHRALRGAVFPLSREQLIAIARENEVPSSVLTPLSNLKGQNFSSWEDLLRALEEGAVEDGRALEEAELRR